MRRRAYDLIVVGGGPAGSTLAGLVKKYNPTARVAILEKARFPRHHVGESLLPGMIPVLKELGVHEKIKQAGFLVKIGAAFVWGKDRTPWDADFNNLNLEMIEKYGRALDTEFSWQVRRSQYDAILLDHARGLGVEVFEDARAAEPIEARGVVGGVVVERAGARESWRSRLVADCSGQGGFLSRWRGTREYREDLKNVAGYAYFRGGRWRYEVNGHPDKTKIFICSAPLGWFWYIPIEKDLVSVGLVCKAEELKRRGVRDFRAEFLKAIQECPEIAPLLATARLERGIDGQDKDFFTAGDWSFTSKRACGPGWLAAGDAAFFLDPLLSSGVMMAHLSAHKAAYAVNSAWREKAPALRKALWTDYDLFCREAAESFAILVRYWYRHDPCAEAWRGAAGAEHRRVAPSGLADPLAFVSIASGISYYFERAYTSQSFLFGALGKEHTWQWEGTKHDLKAWTRQVLAIVETGFLKPSGEDDARVADAEAMTRLKALPESAVPRWRVRPRRRVSFLPDSGTGTLRPLYRAEFPLWPGQPPARRLLPATLWRVLALVDGRRSVAELRAAVLDRIDVPVDQADGLLFRLLKDLAVLGALVFEEKGRTSRSRRAAPRKNPFRDGERALTQGDCQEAERLLTLAIATGRGGAWSHALRGEARRHLGRPREALGDLDAALAVLDIAERDAARDGRTLARRLDVFDERIRRGWIRDRILILRGRLRLQTGDAAGARADADAALRLNAKHSEALTLRAKACRAQGALEASRGDLVAALAIEKAQRRGEG